MTQIFIFLLKLEANIVHIIRAIKNHKVGIGLGVVPVKHIDKIISKMKWEINPLWFIFRLIWKTALGYQFRVGFVEIQQIRTYLILM